MTANQPFALKDLEDISYFLGIQVCKNQYGLHLSQAKYVLDLLDKLGMTNIEPCPTPAVTSKHFSANEGDLMSNLTLYRSAIGALQYLTHT